MHYCNYSAPMHKVLRIEMRRNYRLLWLVDVVGHMKAVKFQFVFCFFRFNTMAKRSVLSDDELLLPCWRVHSGTCRRFLQAWKEAELSYTWDQ